MYLMKGLINGTHPELHEMLHLLSEIEKHLHNMRQNISTHFTAIRGSEAML